MDRVRRIAWCLGWLLVPACGSSSAAVAPATTPEAVQPPSADAQSTAEAIDGLWVEFWALQGHADTQRYELFADGRFGWCAATDGPARGARRWGQWNAQGDELVLRVQGQDGGQDCQGASCRIQHDPPIEERLQLGPCPPNEEAKALDGSYRCISIAGQAFWRRAQAGNPSDYFAD